MRKNKAHTTIVQLCELGAGDRIKFFKHSEINNAKGKFINGEIKSIDNECKIPMYTIEYGAGKICELNGLRKVKIIK